MEASDPSSTQQNNNHLNMFLANTRSSKGKTTEIQTLTIDYDIICLTETHIDETTMNSHDIIPTDNKTVFRRDRNTSGGGVLVAIENFLQPIKVDLDTQGEELLIIKMKYKMILCCYYRPLMSMQNMTVLSDLLEQISNKYHGYSITLVGDFNLPEIN